MSWGELIGNKEFVAATFDLKDEVFEVHVVFISSRNLDIHLFYRA